MPTEIRHLMFTVDEVIEALRPYLDRIGRPLPSGSITRGTINGAGTAAPISFSLMIEPARRGEVGPDRPGQQVVLDAPNLAGALILHCRHQRIPLPAGGSKSVEAMGGAVALVIRHTPRQRIIAAAPSFARARS